MTTERIQKILARAGVGSRREVESWITAGRITVEGRPAVLGQRLTGREAVSLDGKRLDIGAAARQVPRVIALHKTVGTISTRKDPQGRPSVFDALPDPDSGRWIAVGRLDINTCGLMLFTTDGELANRLMHPSSEVPRYYAVRVLGQPGPEDLSKLLRGLQLEDGPARFEKMSEGRGEGANRWFDVMIREGRKREVRRLWEAAGFKVNRLIRTGFGPVRLHREQKPGTVRTLKSGELAALYKAAGLAPPDNDDRPKAKKTRRRKAPRGRTRGGSR